MMFAVADFYRVTSNRVMFHWVMYSYSLQESEIAFPAAWVAYVAAKHLFMLLFGLTKSCSSLLPLLLMPKLLLAVARLLFYLVSFIHKVYGK